MRKWVLVICILPLLLCGCEREPLTDPVLFCKLYNRASPQPIRETDVYLRSRNEFLLFSGQTLIRLRTNEDGAVDTAVVTGKASRETAEVVRNTFAVLAQPFADEVPPDVLAQCAQPALSVQSAQTKRFVYAVYRDGETVTAVQVNRLLTSLPDPPSLRPSESE